MAPKLVATGVDENAADRVDRRNLPTLDEL